MTCISKENLLWIRPEIAYEEVKSRRVVRAVTEKYIFTAVDTCGVEERQCGVIVFANFFCLKRK